MGPRYILGGFERRENLLHLPGFETQTVLYVASRQIDCAMAHSASALNFDRVGSRKLRRPVLDSSGLGLGPVTDAGEHANEASGCLT
jgi:hypothetical protein